MIHRFLYSYETNFVCLFNKYVCWLCSYSAIAWIASFHRGVVPGVEYGSRFSTDAGNVFGFLGGLGTMAFGYAGHNVVLEIQATMPSTPEKPSKIAMWRGFFVAYLIVAMLYFPIAVCGYWAFGNTVEDNILMSLEKPRWLIVAANVFVVVHVTGSYQVHYIISLSLSLFMLCLKTIL